MMSKKIISLLLALLMLAGLLSVSAFAAEADAALDGMALDAANSSQLQEFEGEFSLDAPQSVKKGEVLSVAVRVKAENIAALGVNFSYDKNVLEYIGYDEGADFAGNASKRTFFDRITWYAGQKSWEESGGLLPDFMNKDFDDSELLVLKFNALAAAESTTITVSKEYAISTNGATAITGTFTFESVSVSVSITEDDASGAETGLLGDVNKDGRVNESDSALIFRYAMDLLSDEEKAKFNVDVADVSGDGRINENDSALVFRYAMDLLTGDKGKDIGKEVVIKWAFVEGATEPNWKSTQTVE